MALMNGLDKRAGRIMGIGLIGGLLFTSVAQAQSSTEVQPDYLDQLKKCQALVDDTSRLECYDKAVGQVVTASDEGEVRIIDKEDVEKTRKGLFGFSLPDLGLFKGKEGEDSEQDLLESVVKSVRVQGRNTVFLTIEEGNAVWRIPGADPKVLRTKPGDKVVLKKAALGSYWIRINGRNGVKGRRVQ